MKIKVGTLSLNVLESGAREQTVVGDRFLMVADVRLELR
jgi:hypothetical protein